jgi:hypothetical protein
MKLALKSRKMIENWSGSFRDFNATRMTNRVRITSSRNQTKYLGIERPARYEESHRSAIVTGIGTEVVVESVGLLNSWHVNVDAAPGAIGQGEAPIANEKRFPGQLLSTCQIQRVSIAVILPGAAAATWLNMASEISK